MPPNSFVLSVQDENERTESNENLKLQDLPDVIGVSLVNQHAVKLKKALWTKPLLNLNCLITRLYCSPSPFLSLYFLHFRPLLLL